MADAFLTRFHEEVREHLNDAQTSRRVTAAQRYRLLKTTQKQLWEKWLRATDQFGTIGYTESDIDLIDGQKTYNLPGGFRRFRKIEYRINGDPNDIRSRMKSVSMNSGQSGIVIIDKNRFQVRPIPRLSATETWTMVFQRGEVPTCHGVLDTISGSNLVLEVTAPIAGAGDFPKLDNFYAGSPIKVYSADTGEGQVGEVASSNYDAVSPTFTLREAFPETPTGTMLWEIPPLITDDGLDSIYAIDVALKIMGRRGRRGRIRDLVGLRSELYQDVKRFLQSTYSDRAPTKDVPVDWEAPDHGYESAVYGY